MIYLRSTLFNLGMIVSLLLFVPPFLLTFPLSPNTRYRIATLWGKFIMWWLRITCNIRYRVSGHTDLSYGPAVILSRHESAWETIALQSVFPQQVWVLKKELLYIPLFGWGLALTSPIAIDRNKKTKALDQVITQGRQRLDMGRWMVIFPEGSRMPSCKMGTFAASGALLAKKTGVSVVPVAHNAGHCWGKDSFLKYPGVIDVVIGEPIDTSDKTAREINGLVEGWVAEQVKMLPPCANV